MFLQKVPYVFADFNQIWIFVTDYHSSFNIKLHGYPPN
jgi:hypothetical protein